MKKPGPPIHPIQAVSAIVESIPKDTVIIGDGAEAYHWLNEVIRQERGGSYITHGFLGTVGMGLGLGLGAQIANPDRRVLCLEGDGAVGFTITEFDTMTHHELPIVVLIMNNRSWGASQHFQEIVSGANRVTGTQLRDARYHDVAEAFGANGYHVTDIKALGADDQGSLRQRQALLHQCRDRPEAHPARSRDADVAVALTAPGICHCKP